MLLVEVDVAEVERHRPRRCAGRTSRRARGAPRCGARAAPSPSDAVDGVLDLGELRRLGQPPRPPRRERRVRARAPAPSAKRRNDRTADEPARDRRGREPAAGAAELGGVLGEHAHVDVVERRGPASPSQPREVGAGRRRTPAGSPRRAPGSRGTGRSRRPCPRLPFLARRARRLPMRHLPLHRRSSSRSPSAVLVVVAAATTTRRSPTRRARRRSSATRSTSGSSRISRDALPDWRIDANDRVGRSTPEGIDELAAARRRARPRRRRQPRHERRRRIRAGVSQARGRGRRASSGRDRCLVWATIVRDGTPRTGFNEVLAGRALGTPQRPARRLGGDRRRRPRAARRRPRARHAGGLRAPGRGDRARGPRLPGPA